MVVGVGVAPGVLRHSAVRRRELALLGRVVARRPEACRGPVTRVTELAAPLPVAAAVGVAALWSYRHGSSDRNLVDPLVIAASGVLARRGVAEVVRRDRPPSAWWWDTPNGYSYPSRHVGWAAFGAMAAADLLSAAHGQAAGRKSARAVVAAIGATRIVLAVHWPSDVVAAWCFATGWRRLLGSGGS